MLRFPVALMLVALSVPVQAADDVLGHFDEDGVGLAWEEYGEFGKIFDLVVEQLGHGVGVAAIF